MTSLCPHCQAQLFPFELKANGTSSMCCKGGKVTLPMLNPLPPELEELYRSRSFRDQPRAYNSAFAFASIGVKADNENELRGRGPSCLRLQGAICHRIGSILPAPGKPAQYSQIYVLDPDEASRRRADIFDGLDTSMLKRVETALRRENPIARAYHSLSHTLARPVEHLSASDNLVSRCASSRTATTGSIIFQLPAR